MAAQRYDVRVRGCKELKDAPSTYYLYPGTSLYYELVVVDKETGIEHSVLRRFSEVRKFWEALRPTAAAVGARLEAFPPASAFLSGAGYTGNLYETNPNSDFAADRVETLRKLMATLTAKVDANGGSLLDLKQAKLFFEIGHNASSLPPKKVVSAERTDDRDDIVLPAKASSPRQPPSLADLSRSTPLAFVTVFVVVLAALYAFAPPNADD